MKSQLENNKHLVKEGDVVIYSDASNVMIYKVLSIDETLDMFTIEAMSEDCNVPKGCVELYFFDGLQHGWRISEKTMEHHRIYDKFEYLD